MFRHLLVLLFVCTPNLVLCQEDGAAESVLPMIQNEEASLKATLSAVKAQMIAKFPEKEDAITKQMQTLETLTDANEAKVHSIFKKYFDAQLKLFSPQLGFGDINIDDYRGLLTEYDRMMLGHFHDFSIEEKNVLIVCPPDFLRVYQKQESTDHVPTWGEFTCALRLMLLEMVNELKAISLPMAVEVFKSMHISYPDYATQVFTTHHICGDTIALPLLLAQKVYEMAPRKHIGTKTVEVPSGTGNSAVLDELKSNGITIEELIELVMKRIVRYYEKLGEIPFCNLKHKVFHLMGEYSPAGMAFKFADTYTCAKMRHQKRAQSPRPSRLAPGRRNE